MKNRIVAFTRRAFLQSTGMFAAGLAAAHAMPMQTSPANGPSAVIAPPALDLASLAQFVDPLPISEIARPAALRPSPADAALKIPYYRLAMRQFETKIHRDVKPTRVWGFGNSSPGPTIEARKDQALLVEWANELSATHLFPIDHSIHGAERTKPDVRAVTHLHGAKTTADSDGYPDDWYVPGKSVTYHYPNHQEAATLWYHDHALGITRLNIFAGLLGFYILRDDFEDALNLPEGKYEIPLALYDRSFDREGQLYYPISGNPKSPWIPEYFGDAILANGKLFPYLDVEPRRYRFRVLNASNGRFLHLSLLSGQKFHQIGTDQGLLAAPVELQYLQVAPGERADIVLDFAGHGGEQVIMKNDAAFTVMQFRVQQQSTSDSSSLPSVLRPINKTPESAAIKARMLTLGEIDDMVQNPMTMLLNNSHWDMPITENPKLDSVEIWNLINLTDDSHPIHLHLVRFQILDRRRFNIFDYYTQGKLNFTGPVVPPSANEAGWKDTVRADPGMVTRIIVKFEGYTGRYVWHCHILEHEDNEMMRPYEVIA
ncbi:MAG TPA: multicopper oxidase [Terriglobales bacterium]|nr:multicopper oxidase [Terriglobales bacterium]